MAVGEMSLIPHLTLADGREGGIPGQAQSVLCNARLSPTPDLAVGRCHQPSSAYRKLSSTSWCPGASSWQPSCRSHSGSSSCWGPRGLSQDIVDDVLASFSIELKGDKGKRYERLS